MSKKHTILLVEDDLPIVSILKQHLEDEHFNLLTALDGVDGLRLALESHPEVILLDIIMPRMDGLTMLKKLREDKWGKNSKVIVLTNLSNPQSEQESGRLMANDFVVKTDLSLHDLVERIKKIL